MTAQERLENYVHQRCLCPCCEADKVCLPDCTYETDCPKEWQMMMAARHALYGDLSLDKPGGKVI